MPTGTTRRDLTLHLAFDLGNTTWKLAFTCALTQKARVRTMPARDLPQLAAEIASAKARFGLAPDAPVVSCYEAGRDGFWVHRALTALGVRNVVVDSSSIEGNRRRRQAKSDRLDASALLVKLVRFHQGERGVWSAVHVPAVEDEDRRQLHRELFVLTGERTRQVNRVKGLLALHGVAPLSARGLPVRRPEIRAWDGAPLPPAAVARVEREWARLTFVRRELRALLAERRALLAAAPYRRRFATGSGRMRRIGIVALARKLLIALWRYVETGVLPDGALLKA